MRIHERYSVLFPSTGTNCEGVLAALRNRKAWCSWLPHAGWIPFRESVWICSLTWYGRINIDGLSAKPPSPAAGRFVGFGNFAFSRDEQSITHQINYEYIRKSGGLVARLFSSWYRTSWLLHHSITSRHPLIFGITATDRLDVFPFTRTRIFVITLPNISTGLLAMVLKKPQNFFVIDFWRTWLRFFNRFLLVWRSLKCDPDEHSFEPPCVWLAGGLRLRLLAVGFAGFVNVAELRTQYRSFSLVYE
jgi:hypothetical protein